MALRLRRGTDAERLLITPVEGELIYTTDTKLLYAGDGTTAGGTLVAGAGGGGSTTIAALTDTDVPSPTNNQVLTWNDGTNKWIATTLPGVGTLEINDLEDVLTTSPVAGETLVYDGVNFKNTPITDFFKEQQNYKINIMGDDSTTIINTDNNRIQGDFYGSSNGNHVGNVMDGPGTGIVLDHTNAVLYGDTQGFHKGDVVNSTETKVLLDHITEVFHGTLNGNVFGEDSGVIVDALTSRVYASTLDTDVINATAVLTVKRITDGALTHRVEGKNGNASLRLVAQSDGVAAGSGYSNSILLGTAGSDGSKNTTALYASENILYLTQDSTGGLSTEAKYITYDSTSGTGKLGIGTYSPSEVLDVAGNIKASGAMQPGVYADNAARDAAITTPTAGMMVFNSTGTKFQGYTGSAWVDLN